MNTTSPRHHAAGATPRAAGITAVMAAVLLFAAPVAFAQGWSVQTLASRYSPSKGNVTLAVALPENATALATVPVRHVLIYQQPLGTPQIKTAAGTVDMTLGGVWFQASPHLQALGTVLMYVDAPSDADGRGISSRPAGELVQDLNAAAGYAKKQFPSARIHLAGMGAAAPLLDGVRDMPGIEKVMLASSALGQFRTRQWPDLGHPVLMLQAPGAQCDAAPFLEAEGVARRSNFQLVKVGYPRQEARQDCGRSSQHVLTGQEAAVANAVVKWLDSGDVPAQPIGHANAELAWRETVITYPVATTFGSNQLEATLFLPEKERFDSGPYPVMVWNHGDVDTDSSLVKNRSRVRDMLVAREFLRLGMAVLMPARRGVGMSEGTYPTGFSQQDADPAYKARVQAEDVLPALAWLKSRPEIDASRIVLAGQSAGGYLAMYIASQNPPGLIGAVDFSGGHTDLRTDRAAGFLNPMMVDGFREFGKTTRQPTLWVFAENDSRYTANTIRASHEAFTSSGGKAQLLLNPPIEGDGHFIHHKPDTWRKQLKIYLSEIGMVGRDK